MKVSDRIVHETVKATDIVNLIAADVLYTRHNNADDFSDFWEGVCPFCTEVEPTFHVSGIEHSMAKYTGGNVGRQVFNCTACGVNGNAVTYVQLRDKCSFAEAVSTLRGGRS